MKEQENLQSPQSENVKDKQVSKILFRAKQFLTPENLKKMDKIFRIILTIVKLFNIGD